MGGGWTFHRKSLSLTRSAVACSADRVAIRAWHGDTWVFDGRTWTELPPLPGKSQGSGYGDGIAISPGGDEVCLEASGKIACWRGASWSLLDMPGWTGPVGAIALFADRELVVVGRGRIGLRRGGVVASYDAATWRDLSAVGGTSLAELWTAGQGGTVMRRTSTGWERMRTGVGGWLRGLRVWSSTQAWAWGEPGAGDPSPLVLRWDGTSWREANAGMRGPMVGLAGPAERPWAVGESFIARFDGTQWAEQLSPTALGEGYQRFGPMCATDGFVAVTSAGRAAGLLVHAL